MDNWPCECKFHGVETASVKTVIITERLIGEGSPESPIRSLIQVWSMDGELIASSLPLNPEGAVDPAYRYLSP